MPFRFRSETDPSVLSDDEMSGRASLVHVLESRYIHDPITEKVVQLLLNGGSKVNDGGYDGRSPIMVAARLQGSVRMMQLLLKHGADLCAQDRHGNTALMHAIFAGWVENVDFLLQFTDKQNFLNLRDSTGLSALSMSVTFKELYIVKEMIRRGADVNMEDVYGDSPLLHWLCKFFPKNIQFLTTLLDAGSDVNQQNHKGLSPLMMAACHFIAQPLQFMVGPDARVGINYLEENSPFLELGPLLFPNFQFMRAAFGCGFDPSCNSYDVCRRLMSARPRFEQRIATLLEAGANVNAVSKNNGTKTALSFMPSVTYRGTVTIFCMDAFLDKFARSSWVNPVVLQEVILHGAVDVIPKLIRCGLLPADIKANTTGLQLHESEVVDLVSPLRLALLVGNVSLARYFMDNLFLTRSDLSSLTPNTTTMTNILQRKKHEKCLNFFNEMSAQPMSLFKQAFVAVSCAVGVAPGRGSKVEQLPLPRTIKDCLQYNSLKCN